MFGINTTGSIHDPFSSIKTLLLCLTLALLVLLLSVLPVSAHGGGGSGGGSGGGGGGNGGEGMVGASGATSTRSKMRSQQKAKQEKEKREKKKWAAFEKAMKEIGEAVAPSPGPNEAQKSAMSLPKGHPESKAQANNRNFVLQRSMSGIDRQFAEQVWDKPAQTLKKFMGKKKSPMMKTDPKYAQKTSIEIGNVMYLLGRFKDAEKEFQKAANIQSDELTLADRAMAKNSLAAVKETLADYESAMKEYGAAINMFQQGNNRNGQAAGLMNMGVMAINRGNLRAAINYFDQSAQLIEDSNKDAKILTLMNYGRGLKKWGFVYESIGNFDKSLELAKEKGDPELITQIIIEKSNALLTTGHEEEAVAMLKETGEQLEEGSSQKYLINHILANVFMDQGDLDNAENYVKKGQYVSDAARLAYLKKDYKEAKKKFDELYENSELFNRDSDRFVSYIGLGKIFESQGELRSAEKMYKRAVQVAERLRMSKLLSERTKFFQTPINGFRPVEAADGLIRVRMKSNRIADSIYPGELTKARMFADTVARRADISKLGVDPKLLEEEETLFNRLAALNKGLSLTPETKDRKRWRDISREIRNVEKDISKFEKKIKSSHELYASVRFPEPLTLSKADLEPDETILVFDVLEDGVAIRLLKGKKILFSEFREISSTELNKMIDSFRRPFERAQLDGFNADLSKKLFATLLQGAVKQVPEGASLIIVPDDSLAALPFDALVSDGDVKWRKTEWGRSPGGVKYVSDRNPLVLRQSLTAITLGRKFKFPSNDGQSLLVMADPVFQASDQRFKKAYAAKTGNKGADSDVKLMEPDDFLNKVGFDLTRLEATGKLAERLKSMFAENAKALTGVSANKDALFGKEDSHLDKYRWIVFATHGYAASDVPGIMEPFIALTRTQGQSDGLVKMSEVLHLKLNADLVAVTACQTGYGEVVEGEGVMSIGRAFQCAGARCLLASLWSVSEVTSVQLMEVLFKGLKQGKTVTQALSDARNDLRGSGYDHPFFWAAFVLTGEVE